jgi:hypothetical protein
VAYRDADELVQRMALEARMSTIAPDDPERSAIADRLAEIDHSRREKARIHLPLIARARIATPCGERFETMLGDGAVRTCARCDREVVDVARMTLGEAEAMLASRAGRMRVYQRADGTMLFADCEVGVNGVRRRQLAVAASAITLASAALMSSITPDRPQVESLDTLARSHPTPTLSAKFWRSEPPFRDEEAWARMIPAAELCFASAVSADRKEGAR